MGRASGGGYAMVRLKLEPAVVGRLAAFLQARVPAESRSGHWDHFSRLNNITADLHTGIVTFTAGPGFDSDYELSFRARTAREQLGVMWRRLNGSEPGVRFVAAFEKIWRSSAPVSLADAESVLGAPMTAHKILACHYANLLLPHFPPRREPVYLEIGPGAGYLASLMQRVRPGPQVFVDLPEILPFSFLTLHRAFPENPVVLPNEIGAAPIRIEENRLLFLASAQTDAVPDGCVDLAVNTASFGEMLPEQIKFYFAFLRRVSKPDGLFFTSNRVEKWMSRPGPSGFGAVAAKEIPIRFKEYPWSSRDVDLFFDLSEFHAIVQPENPVYNRLCQLARASSA